MEIINKKTGLNPNQETAAFLLATGKNITDTAKELNIERSTLYLWASKENFKAYFNSLCLEAKEVSQNSLIGLVDEALDTVKESLKSDNPNVKLKAALAILDRVKSIDVGITDPIEMIKGKCIVDNSTDFENVFLSIDENKLNKLLSENNLNQE